MATAKRFSSAREAFLLEQLAGPFDPDLIDWRVTDTSRDGKYGAVFPFADLRAYVDRLNRLFTPAGWTQTYSISTVSSLTHQKKGQTVQSGKVVVSGVVTIHGLGSHSGSGEQWADQREATASAEAQAFRRACSCFGLGRYLYRFREIWVPLNEYGKPQVLPTLPKWARPAKTGTSRSPYAPIRTNGDVRGPIDRKVTKAIETFRRVLGKSIYSEILKRAGHATAAKDIPNADRQATALRWMERAAHGFERLHVLAEATGEKQFIAILDQLGIRTTTTIPSLDLLSQLVKALDAATKTLAA